MGFELNSLEPVDESFMPLNLSNLSKRFQPLPPTPALRWFQLFKVHALASVDMVGLHLFNIMPKVCKKQVMDRGEYLAKFTGAESRSKSNKNDHDLHGRRSTQWLMLFTLACTLCFV